MKQEVEKVEKFLKANNIDYILHEHPAVFTCEEAEERCKIVKGMPCKNLFLTNKSKSDYYLVIIPAVKRLNLSLFGDVVGIKKVKFVNEEDMMNLLGLTPGSVSPMGLLNDNDKKVKVFLDKDIWEAEIVSFHPNINTGSVEVTKEMFHKVMDCLDHEYEVIEM